jgi:hypothetical protein
MTVVIRAVSKSWRAKACVPMRNDSRYLASGGLFDVAMLSLFAVAVAGVRHELAVALWIGTICAAAKKFRASSVPQLAAARIRAPPDRASAANLRVGR